MPPLEGASSQEDCVCGYGYWNKSLSFHLDEEARWTSETTSRIGRQLSFPAPEAWSGALPAMGTAQVNRALALSDRAVTKEKTQSAPRTPG